MTRRTVQLQQNRETWEVHHLRDGEPTKDLYKDGDQVLIQSENRWIEITTSMRPGNNPLLLGSDLIELLDRAYKLGYEARAAEIRQSLGL